MESADVVIAGGGIMGCALAYQLSKRNVDVLLLERETLGSQSTGKCAGGVRQQFSSEGNVRLQRMSVGMLERFEEEIGHPADFRQIGYLFVLTQPQQVEDFRRNMEMWHRVGLTEARWVDAIEAARMVPILNAEDVLGCTFCPTDGIASPADVTSGYAAAARRLGARLKEGVAVTGIDVAAGRVQGVQTSAGDVATRLVFNCAGAWSPSIGRMAGLEIPVLPYRRHIAVTSTFRSVPRNNPMTVDFQTSLYFHPEGDGVLIGMSDREEPPGFVTDVNWDFLEKMFAQAGSGARRGGHEDRMVGSLRGDSRPPGHPGADPGAGRVLVRCRVQWARVHAGAGRGPAAYPAAAGSHLRDRHLVVRLRPLCSRRAGQGTEHHLSAQRALGGNRPMNCRALSRVHH
jgi:sarcosine oxidase subunit beta